MAQQCSLFVRQTIHCSHPDHFGQAYQCVIQAVAQRLVFGYHRTSGIQRDESIRTLLQTERVDRSLPQTYHATDGKRQVLVAGGLSAPRCAISIRLSVHDTYSRIIIVQQSRSGYMLYPKGSVSAFTCAACPHEQVGLPVPIHRRRMDGHGILAKNGLSIGNAQQRGKRLSHLIVRPL